MKIELILKVDRFGNMAFTWSYVIYHAALGHENFEDGTTEHLDDKTYATIQEILECQQVLWAMLKPVA